MKPIVGKMISIILSVMPTLVYIPIPGIRKYNHLQYDTIEVIFVDCSLYNLIG